MNLSGLDWIIVFAILIFMIASVIASKTLMRSVSDFLAAGRTAGRYLISVSVGVAGLGAITIVGNLEMNLIAGFSMAWWGLTMSLIVLIIKVSGWVIYRYRQTRSLTLAQFFETRYSRKFRIFAGLTSFVSGLINFGIFPSVGARFFIYFCGLPHSFDILGLTISTFPVVMIGLLSVSLYFVFAGGQIAVIITDFLQGTFINIVFIILIIYLIMTFNWDLITQGLITAPENASMINPFKTGHVKDFNLWYFLIGVVGVLYNAMSWQGTQGYNASAKSAHEAKIGGVLEGWRGIPQTLMLMFIPIVAYVVLNHPDYSQIASSVTQQISSGETEAIRSQLKVPMVLSHILPRGLMGAFVAVMLAAFISTHDTYLHSWGSIFIQDVVMPFRKEPFKPKQHMKMLRWAVVGVAIFIFMFSLLVKQTEYIFLFFAITGAIFVGGSGAVIIGGLYWKKGTTAAAWSALITGSTIALTGIFIHQFVEDFPINGQVFWFLGMLTSTIVYILVSLLGKQEDHDMDKLLNRGKYANPDELKVVNKEARGWKILGMGKEFTKGDKFIYIINYVWTISWTIVFIVGTVYNLTHEVSNEAWMQFWKIFVLIQLGMACIVMVWFTIGGAFDLKKMIQRLRTMDRDDSDDGFIKAKK
jgi:solute:Na+ symporter, SSS family